MSSNVRRRKRNTAVSARHRKTVLIRVGDGEEEEEIEQEVELFVTDPAYVRVEAGTTKNLGNYESLRVSVAISTPCYKERVEETFEDTAERVAEMLEEEVEKYLGE